MNYFPVKKCTNLSDLRKCCRHARALWGKDGFSVGISGAWGSSDSDWVYLDEMIEVLSVNSKGLHVKGDIFSFRSNSIAEILIPVVDN